MKFLIFAFIGLAVAMAASSKNSDNHKHWHEYKQKHNKNYTAHEEELRKEIFLNKKAHVDNHNERFKKGEVPFSIGLNEFSDMTEDEKTQRFGARFDNHHAQQVRRKRLIGSQNYAFQSNGPIFHIFSADSTFAFPASVDWRTTGWNESVRNQGSCGSCWAFSSSTANSFYQFNKTKTNVVLSPQNLVDCATVWGAGKCNGADPGQAMEYMMVQKQTTDAKYPYKGVNGTCSVPSGSPLYGINGFVYINNDMKSLKQAVAQLGVVVISINADNLMDYAGGIWDGTDSKTKAACSTSPNHAVALIGYGTDASGNPYWLVKNSWGPSWGEKGYFRMAMTSTNLCGIYSSNYAMV